MADRLRSKRVIVPLGVCALALIGVAVAFTLAPGGGRSVVLPTTGQFAPFTVKRQPLVSLGGAILDDPEASVLSELSLTLYPLRGAGHYRLTVTNVSGIGYVNSFQWYPPLGINIERVAAVSSGHCRVTGVTGFGGNQFKSIVLYPNILCDGLDLRPPSCTCRGDGGSVTLSFYLSEATQQSGVARLVSATPVLKPIPSYLSGP